MMQDNVCKKQRKREAAIAASLFLCFNILHPNAFGQNRNPTSSRQRNTNSTALSTFCHQSVFPRKPLSTKSPRYTAEYGPPYRTKPRLNTKTSAIANKNNARASIRETFVRLRVSFSSVIAFLPIKKEMLCSQAVRVHKAAEAKQQLPFSTFAQSPGAIPARLHY